MNTPTTNYIEIDGEGKYIEDTDAREGVSQNAVQINAIQEVIPSGTAANNKLVNATQLLESFNQTTAEVASFVSGSLHLVKINKIVFASFENIKLPDSGNVSIPEGFMPKNLVVFNPTSAINAIAMPGIMIGSNGTISQMGAQLPSELHTWYYSTTWITA